MFLLLCLNCTIEHGAPQPEDILRAVAHHNVHASVGGVLPGLLHFPRFPTPIRWDERDRMVQHNLAGDPTKIPVARCNYNFAIARCFMEAGEISPYTYETLNEQLDIRSNHSDFEISPRIK